MNAVVTVAGTDRKGIIAAVSGFLAERGINVLDISQTILNGQFAMVMIVDLSECAEDFSALAASLSALGKEIGMGIRIQHEDLFNAMHVV